MSLGFEQAAMPSSMFKAIGLMAMMNKKRPRKKVDAAADAYTVKPDQVSNKLDIDSIQMGIITCAFWSLRLKKLDLFVQVYRSMEAQLDGARQVSSRCHWL